MSVRYANADDVLPEELVRELRRYVRGRIWIPATERRRIKTARDPERNQRIRQMHADGMSVREIAGEVCLCEERVRQILKEK